LILGNDFNIQLALPAMPYEEIDNPIEIITFFEHGKLHPLRFKWKGKVYKISRVNSSWIIRQGVERSFHFSVDAGTSDCFEIVFNVSDLNWRLARVYLEG